MSEEKLSFQAEVSRLLDIVAHSLYSNKEIFLRELISNASDACDRLRYAALTAGDLMGSDPEFRIRIAIDGKAKTLTVSDNGIGMNRGDLVENLGTIARSGTAAFISELDDKKDGAGLIGQFGVGFYSAFMVADRVEVTTRKAGDAEAWRWASDGKGEFTISEADDGPERGSRISLTLKKEEKEFLDPARIRAVIKTYSDHIAIPILLEGSKESADEEKPAKKKAGSARRRKSTSGGRDKPQRKIAPAGKDAKLCRCVAQRGCVRLRFDSAVMTARMNCSTSFTNVLSENSDATSSTRSRIVPSSANSIR